MTPYKAWKSLKVYLMSKGAITMDDRKVWKYEDDSNDNLNLIVTAIYENDYRTFKKALAYLAKLRNTSEERLMFEITKAMYWREFRRGRNK